MEKKGDLSNFWTFYEASVSILENCWSTEVFPHNHLWSLQRMV